MNSPLDRSRAALPENIRKTLEESNLPVEVATAIADLCDGLIRPEEGGSSDQDWEPCKDSQQCHSFGLGCRLQAINEAIEACNAERLDDPHGTEEDKAYTTAIDHCVQAITALKTAKRFPSPQPQQQRIPEKP